MDTLDDILLNIVLARAASASGSSSGITLLSSEAILARIFGDIASPALLRRCATELDGAEQNLQRSEALDELVDLVSRHTESNAKIEQQLTEAQHAIHDLAGICLLASSRIVPRLDLVLHNPAIFDYIRRIDYRGKGGARTTLIGRLHPGDEDVLIDPDLSNNTLSRLALRYRPGVPWPFLTLAQSSFDRNFGDRTGFQNWPQSSDEANDLRLRTNARIITRLESLPCRIPLMRGTLQIAPQTPISIVKTTIIDETNITVATYFHVVDTDALSARK